ncbi:unnamed protein product [Gongylonema pulchrum]|uniref:Uncharacterized protein n=1 Tax=Gongylonema pulchrum TaxID=637853 RepID=A0A3P7MSV9_9BILA|nr:unnamed protein product [Gongylonema pulchrum]
MSLATIDRETTDRYRETQEQALKLVDLFKAGIDVEASQPTIEAARPVPQQQPLCFNGRPPCCYKFLVLLSLVFTFTLFSESLFEANFFKALA